MKREVINELKKYTKGKRNTEKTEISVLALNRLIFALEENEPCEDCVSREYIINKCYDLDNNFVCDLYDIREAPSVQLKPKTDVLDKIKAEIEGYKSTIDNAISEDELTIEGMKEAYTDCLKIIDKYKAESEG